MNIVYLLLPIAVMLGGFFLAAFLWGASRDQFEDLETPSHRILIPDPNEGEQHYGGK